MKVRKSVWIGVLVLALIPNAAFGFTEPKQDDKAMMDAMMKAAAPGEQHKQLEALVGSWVVDVKAWMAPDQPPMASKGSSQITSILGGRYFREEFSGEFMKMPFSGSGLTGYDNSAKQYVTVWVDSMSTSITRLTGTFDASTKTYTFNGMATDPMSGQEKASRMAIRVESRNKHVIEWYDPTPDGKWAKVLEIAYTRK